MKLISFLILFAILLASAKGSICNNKVCCPNSCKNCTLCTGSILYKQKCCEVEILEANKTCKHHPPPCVIFKNVTTIEKDFLGELKDLLTVANAILLGIVGIILICMIGACFCFDRRKPAVSYDDIEYKGAPWVNE